MRAPCISGLGEPACRDPREFGGKAAGLAGLAAAGLPVASGFAIGVTACRAFRDGDREAVVTAIRDRYRRLCQETGDADLEVAVRSSATAEDSAAASFAGGFETWIGVAGADAVVEHVRRCWTSVGTARAVAYARDNGIDPAGIEMAVVVQRAVRARAAGVMFTISPATGDRSRIVIEASWGLGLAVVGGEVTPDRWVVDKVGTTVAACTPGDKRVEYRRGDAAVPVDPARWALPCLTDEQVVALARLGKEIERREGGPQDIEFAIEGDAPVLLQCRPETVWSGRPRVLRFDPGQNAIQWISAIAVGG
jgi:pyruvate, water dikinase